MVDKSLGVVFNDISLLSHLTRRKMKKILISSFITISTLSISPLVMADPSEILLTFECPSVQNLGNSGMEIAGFGVKKIQDRSYGVYFSSKNNNDPRLPAGIPSNLSSYRNSLTNYDGITQTVACGYGNPTDPLFFQVSYPVTNARNALVVSKTDFSITISIPIGLTK